MLESHTPQQILSRPARRRRTAPGLRKAAWGIGVAAALATGCGPSRADREANVPDAADSAAIAEQRLLANPNTQRAGVLKGDTLNVALEVRSGSWYPDEEDGRHETVLAFAESGKAGRVPGPLLRVHAGVTIQASVHNTRQSETLTVHGLSPTDTRILPGSTGTITFRTSTPGTYFYWASTNGSALEKRRALDSQLNGAIVVDSAGVTPPKTDRVFVLSIWDVPIDSTGPKPWVSRTVMAINGKAWPHTERFDYAVGDTARWRWVNPTFDAHPMHLHGFYFNVISRGGALADTVYQPSDQRTAVTEMMLPGGTMAMQFVPTVPGHWLFHCHFTFHVSHYLSFDLIPDDVDAGGPEPNGHQHSMRGLVLGINVRAPTAPPKRMDVTDRTAPTRQLRLVAGRAARRFDKEDGYAYALNADSDAILPMLSSTIELKRGEPVAITVVNKLRQSTAVHWHGIELQDSYVDGVPLWSGHEGKLAPPIAPNDSFIAHFTPPRAGTFIYHSHSNEEHQIGYGLYGALIVRDSVTTNNVMPEETFVIGSDGPNFTGGRVNGMLKPSALTIQAGTTYRFRIVQINPEMRVYVSLKQGKTILQWKPVAKDGADLPANQQVLKPARIMMGPGETMDVEITLPAMNGAKLEVSSLGASWLSTVPLVLRERSAAVQKSHLH